MTLAPSAPTAALPLPTGTALWRPEQADLVRVRTRALARSLGVMTLSAAVQVMQAPARLARAHTRRSSPSWTVGEPVVDLPALVRALHDCGEWTNAFAALQAAPAHHVRPQDLDTDLAAVRARSDVAGLLLSLGTGTDRAADLPSRDAWHAGDRDRALRLLQAEGSTPAALAAPLSDVRDRVRVVGVDLVDTPLTDYQEWMVAERAHRAVRADHDLRILPRTKAAHLTLDTDRPLRDVVVVARRVVYELGHDRAGHLDRVRRIEDPILAALVADQVLDLAVWADHAPAVAAAHRARAGRP